MEIWKDIKDYENYYQVSNLGNIRNKITNKILVGDTNSGGYKRVSLYQPLRKRFFVHRLVAYHFCENYSIDKVVNHKDGNKQNNCASNLEWVTRSENDLHAFKNNLRKIYPSQFRHKIMMFKINGEFIKEFKNIQDCCNELNVRRTQIYNCCNGKAKTCKGYILKYKN